MTVTMGNATLEEVLKITLTRSYIDSLDTWDQDTIDALDYEACDDDDLDELYDKMTRIQAATTDILELTAVSQTLRTELSDATLATVTRVRQQAKDTADLIWEEIMSRSEDRMLDWPS